MSEDDDEYHYSSHDEEAHDSDMIDVTPVKTTTTSTPIPIPSAKHQTPLSAVASSAGSASSLASRRKHARHPEYACLSPADLQADQNSLTQEVAEVLNIPADHASVLLLKYKWNKEKLYDAYYSDAEGTRAAAGALQGPLTVQMAKLSKGGQFWCSVLYEGVPVEYTFSMGCERPGEPEHRFSIEAWQEYLVTKVGAGFSCIFAQCPFRGCKCIVSPRVWRHVLSTAVPVALEELEAGSRQKALDKYEHHLSNSYVDMNRNIKWCTGNECGWAVMALGVIAEAECDHCHSKFCFKCRRDAHAPLTCKGLDMWNEKCSNESETANWFVAHTKKCPACSTYIEKNNGCNHMNCANCKHEFCWVCLGDWKSHSNSTGGYYNCNRFTGPDPEKEQTAQSAKRELDRYIFYYTRFQGHQQSLKFAKAQRDAAEKRMLEMQKNAGTGLVDVQFLMDAVEQLIECRRVLMYTYAFAFFLQNGPRKDLFEFNQGMLEANTEVLSRLCEMDLVKVDRSQMINFTRVTQKFRTQLLEEVAREEREGFGSV